MKSGLCQSSVRLILALSVLVPLSLSAGEHPIRALLLQQAPSGNHNMTLDALRETGMEVTWISAKTISDFPTDVAAMTAQFDVMFFGSLGREGGIGKLLTEEQLGALRGFVKVGGGLVTVIAESAGVLGDLLPVTVGNSAGPGEFRPRVLLPDHPVLCGLPALWPTFGSRWNSFNRVTARQGATVLMSVDAEGTDARCPFLTVWAAGKGRVVCMNSLWAFTTGLDFKRWEWSPVFFLQSARWAIGRPPISEKDPKPIEDPLWFWKYDREALLEAAGSADTDSVSIAPETEPVQAHLPLRWTPEPKEESIAVPPVVVEDAEASKITFGNGICASILHNGAISYCLENGTPLCQKSSGALPRLLFSGQTEAKMTNADGGEFAVLSESLPDPQSLGHTLKYTGYANEGTSTSVSFVIETSAGTIGTLTVRLTPRSTVIDGVAWREIGETITVNTPNHFVEEVIPGHHWGIGGKNAGHFTFRSGCYSKPRGYAYADLAGPGPIDAGHFRWFSSGQPFQMFGSPQGTMWAYADTPAYIASWLLKPENADYILMVNKINVGRCRGTCSTPTIWYCYTPTRMDHTLWMESYSYLRKRYRDQFGIKPSSPRPTAMMRFDTMGFVDLRRYADVLLPVAHRLGYRRIDCGIRYVHDMFNPHHGGLPALKYLCDRAHALDIEVFFYCGTAWCKSSFPPLKEHPEWIIRDRSGKPRATGYPDLYAVSLRSGWWDYSLAKYKELKEATGMDGVWLDSWTMPNEYINFAEAEAKPGNADAVRYVKAIQDLGYTVMVEGQSPVALDSFWYRHDRYAEFAGNEFCLFNTTPFAYGGNGTMHLDLFRLVSYNCAMFQDPRLFYPFDSDTARRVTCINGLMNTAHDMLGFPRHIRECSVGTVWECPRGFAIFAFRRGDVSIEVPAGRWDIQIAGQGRHVTLKELTGGLSLNAGDIVFLKRKNDR